MNKFGKHLGIVFAILAPSAVHAESLHAFDEIYIVIASVLLLLVGLFASTTVLLRKTRAFRYLFFTTAILYVAPLYFALPLLNSTISDLAGRAAHSNSGTVHAFSALFVVISAIGAIVWAMLFRRLGGRARI